MKLIFLDIDGVLNSVAWQDTQRQRGGYGLGPYRVAYWARRIDPAAVQRLNRLLAGTGAAVVVSSAWRTLLTRQELTFCLTENGFMGEIIGETPEKEAVMDYGFPAAVSRWEEIALYLAGWGQTPEYAILDDDPMPDAPTENFVRTDYKVGLTDADADRAITILNGAITILTGECS